VSCRLLTYFTLLLAIPLAIGALGSDDPAQVEVDKVGVVCHIRVLSDKVPDVGSLESWKHSFIKNDMTDQ